MAAKSYRVPETVVSKIVSILEDERVGQHNALSAQELASKYVKLTRRSLRDAMQCDHINEDWWILLRSARSFYSIQIGLKPTTDTVVFFIERPLTVEQEKLKNLVTRFITKSNGTIAGIKEQYRPSGKYESLSKHIADVFDGISLKNLLLKVIRARVDDEDSKSGSPIFSLPPQKNVARTEESSQASSQLTRVIPMQSPQAAVETTYQCPASVRDKIISILTSENATKNRPMSAVLLANAYFQRTKTKMRLAMNCEAESKPWYALLCNIGGGVQCITPRDGRRTAETTQLYITKPPKQPMTEAKTKLIRDVKLLLNGSSFQQEFTCQDVEDRYAILYGHSNGSLVDNVRVHFDGISVEDFMLKIIKVNDDDDNREGNEQLSSSPSSVLGKRPRQQGRRRRRLLLTTVNSHGTSTMHSVRRGEDHHQEHQEQDLVPQFSPVPIKHSKVTFAATNEDYDHDITLDNHNASFSPIQEEVPITNSYDNDEDDDKMDVDNLNDHALPTQQQQAVITQLSVLIQSIKDTPFEKAIGAQINEFLMENVANFNDESLIILLSYCGDGKPDDPVPAAVKWIKLRFFERALNESSIATQLLTADRMKKLFQIMFRKLCCSFRTDTDLLTAFLQMLTKRLDHYLSSHNVIPGGFDAETLAECFYSLRHTPVSDHYLNLLEALSKLVVVPFMSMKFNRGQLAKIILGLKSVERYDERLSRILLRIASTTEITLPTLDAIQDHKETLHQCKSLGKGLQRILQSAARGGGGGERRGSSASQSGGADSGSGGSVTSSTAGSSSPSISLPSLSAGAGAGAGAGAVRVITDSNLMKPLLFLISTWTQAIESLLTRSSLPKDDDLIAFLFQSLKDQGLAISLYPEFRRLLVTFVRYTRGRSMTMASKDDMKVLENILAFIASMKNYDSNISEVRELLVYFTKELTAAYHHIHMLTDYDREVFYKRAISHGYGPLLLQRALCSLRSDCIAVRHFVMALRPWLEQHASGHSSSGAAIKKQHVSAIVGLAGLGASLRQALTNPTIQYKTILEDYEDQFLRGFLLPAIEEHFNNAVNIVDSEIVVMIVMIAPALKVAEDVVFDRFATLLAACIANNMTALLSTTGDAMIVAIAAIITALLEGDSQVSDRDHGERALSESYRSLLAICFVFLKSTTDGGIMTTTLSLEAFRAVLNITLSCCNHVCLLPTAAADAYSLLTGCIQSLISTIRLAGEPEKKLQLTVELLYTVCCNSSLTGWLAWYQPVSEMALLTAFNVFFRHVQAFTVSTEESVISQARCTFNTMLQSMTTRALISEQEQEQEQCKLFVDRLIGSIACSLYPIKIERDMMLLPCLLRWSSSSVITQPGHPAYDYIRSTLDSLMKELLDMKYIHLLINTLKTKIIAKEAVQLWRETLSNYLAKHTMKGSCSLSDVHNQRVAVLQDLTQPGRAEYLLTLMLPLLIPNNNHANEVEVDPKFASLVVLFTGILLAIAWTNPPLTTSSSSSSTSLHSDKPDAVLEYCQAIRWMRLPVILDDNIVAGSDPLSYATSKILPAVKHIIGEVEDNLFTDIIMKRIGSMNGEQYLDSYNLSYVYEGMMSTFVSHERLRARFEAKNKLESLLNDVYLRGKGVISYPQYDTVKAINNTKAGVVPSWWSTAIEDETVLPFVSQALYSAASQNPTSVTAQYAWASFSDHVLVSGLPALLCFDYVVENEGMLAVQLTRLNIAINSQSSDNKAGYMVSPGLLKIIGQQDNKIAVDDVVNKQPATRMKLLVDVIPIASTTQHARLPQQQKALDEDALLRCRVFDGCIQVRLFVSTNPNCVEEEGEESSWSHLTLIKSRTKRMLSMLLKSLEL